MTLNQRATLAKLPKWLRCVGPSGSVKSHTVSRHRDLGRAAGPWPSRGTLPRYSPAGASLGTRTSIHIGWFWPSNTSNGRAIHVVAAGHHRFAPARLMLAQRFDRLAGHRVDKRHERIRIESRRQLGPGGRQPHADVFLAVELDVVPADLARSGPGQVRDFARPRHADCPSSAATTTWNDSTSFRAASNSADGLPNGV